MSLVHFWLTWQDMFRSQALGAHHWEADWLDSQTSSRYTLVRALTCNIKVQYLKGKVMLSTDNRLNWQCNPFKRHQVRPRWSCHLFHLSRHVWWKNEQDARAIQCWPNSAEEKHPRRLAKRKSTFLSPCHTLPRMNSQSLMAILSFLWRKEHKNLRSEIEIDIRCGHQRVESCLRRRKNLRSRSRLWNMKGIWAELNECKESLISYDYFLETPVKARGWYFHLQLYPSTNCTSRNYT